MAKGYWIAVYHSVADASTLGRYAAQATPVLLAHGARFLARGTPARTFEGGANERCVVIEFPSVEMAVAAYESAEYQAVLSVIRDSVRREVRIVPGVD